jgi:Domain of unknown function (DUF4157)
MVKQQAQKTPATPQSVSSVLIPLLQPRAFGESESSTSQHSQPTIQEKNGLSAIGHSLGKMNLGMLSRLPIQPKLTIGKVGDPYEQEADRVAAQVVERIHAPQTQAKNALRRKPAEEAVQRSATEEDELQMKPLVDSIQCQAEEEDELQMKPNSIQRQEEEDELQMKPSLQRQEQEEDELQMKPNSIQRQEEEDELQMKPNSIQRQEEEDELQMKSNALQRRADLGGMAAPTNIESSINQARGGGQGLSASIRQPMEQAFGTDFGNVRVHTDDRANQLNRSINAQAFTTRSDIFFGQGKYDPGSKNGQELIAHELTHVVQQGGSTLQKSVPSSRVLRKPQVSNGLIQRGLLSKNNDPVAAYNNPSTPYNNAGTGGDKSLLYGIDANRQATKDRLAVEDKKRTQDSPGLKVPIRTIDEYNKMAGINGVISRDGANLGIFIVREMLSGFQTGDAASWGSPIGRKNAAQNPDLLEWMNMLKQNEPSIGLYDLGDSTLQGTVGSQEEAGLQKIKSKHRFTKNISKDTAQAAGDFKPEDVYAWLDPNRNLSEAESFAKEMDKTNLPKRKAISEWIYKAFFRRTSKLGIDFVTTQLNAKVNFNTAMAQDWKSKKKKLRTPTAGGVAKAAINPDANDRQITISEFRHLAKQVRKGNVPISQVNIYDEY